MIFWFSILFGSAEACMYICTYDPYRIPTPQDSYLKWLPSQWALAHVLIEAWKCTLTLTAFLKCTPASQVQRQQTIACSTKRIVSKTSGFSKKKKNNNNSVVHEKIINKIIWSDEPATPVWCESNSTRRHRHIHRHTSAHPLTATHSYLC